MVTKIVVLDVDQLQNVQVIRTGYTRHKPNPLIKFLRFTVVAALFWFLLIILSLMFSSRTSAEPSAQNHISQNQEITASFINGAKPSDQKMVSIEEAFLQEAEDEAEQAPVFENSAIFIMTGYCSCEKCCGKWALNRQGPVIGAACVPLIPGISVAVDDSIFSMGQILTDAEGHEYIAHDTGSAVKGYHIDVYCETHEEARQIGKQEIELFW